MEKNTEDQILNELKNINNSLQDINEKIDNEKGESKGPSLVSDILRSFLQGVFIVGPAIVVVIMIFQITGDWIFN
ncbi:hypothetical protein IMZ31_07555 [Pontibacillus sp. ALD_SL1]|uniref:hypothetical protein n=1 Tax=Pontibacillus sp. ALD_SL1 TaxID=2777185 RepID=UPI001A96F14F|nr:hypothetical protein [Pontibacillus sp. ALD_SL1]QST01403.1 hypothetical protein IMZ31_07555 [Pontibacillus sp. ALD_SL1]